MQCMKCGREIPADRAFCEECLADMEKYPAEPGVIVRIPSRREEPQVKKPAPRRKNQRTPEEQVKRLKRRLWIMGVTMTLLLAMVSGCLYMALSYIWENEGKPLPGQNYSTAETKEPSEPAAN